ncbi:MAG: hypothetical protein KAI75_02225, partial [Desulfobulbaceae bacterium]|nr:hypothetical protein [Desulfobulbaceae bacterium]
HQEKKKDVDVDQHKDKDIAADRKRNLTEGKNLRFQVGKNRNQGKTAKDNYPNAPPFPDLFLLQLLIYLNI